MKRVAVLLAGCGLYDGSEPHETVLLLLSLRRHGLRPFCLAPDIDQTDVVDPLTGRVLEGAAPRNVLAEAARLARGDVRSVTEPDAAEADALAIPGGFGVPKNLCRPGARLHAAGDLRPELERMLRAMAERRAPIAVIGLAEVLLARLHGRPLAESATSVAASDVVVDESRRTLFTPGFLGSADPLAVAEGIDRLASRLAVWLGAAAPKGE